jgi:hypothetical protein
MREVKATRDQGKPHLLVHEADITHGGAPLEVLKLELDDLDLRDWLFARRPVVVFQRISDFQVCEFALAREPVRASQTSSTHHPHRRWSS